MFVLQLCALSHPPCSPCDLWVRVNIQDVLSNTHNERPFTSQGRTGRRRSGTFSLTSDSLSLHLSIISPHLSEHRMALRLCPHPHIAMRPCVCQPVSQTNPLSPYPPCSTTPGCILCVNMCQSTLRTACSPELVEQTTCVVKTHSQSFFPE